MLYFVDRGAPVHNFFIFLKQLCIAVKAAKQIIHSKVCNKYCQECYNAVCVEEHGTLHSLY